MPGTTCNWGILGTARIATKVVEAMKLAPDAHPMAIGSRSIGTAESFASEHGLERAYGSYDEVLQDPDIDVVYIPLPTTMHMEWTIKAAEAGKHVLCEKPMTPCAADLERMIAACDDANVQLMDGVMFMHHPRTGEITNHLPSIGGRPTYMVSVFTFPGSSDFFESNIRINPDAEPLGCIGDLGWYNTRMSLLAFGHEMPRRVRSNWHATCNGVPTHATCELEFDGNAPSTFQCSFLHTLRNWCEICGSDGTLFLEDFVLGPPEETRYYTKIQERDAQGSPREVKTEHSVDGCVQEALMVQQMCSIALGRDPIDPYWTDIALKTQRIMDALMISGAEDGRPVEIE
ncbi:MAG: hypothetical protein CMJ32_04595 [Phycisphaerae bacterium]|nr:hypothetical protein [Phycisphaerae bacterium]